MRSIARAALATAVLATACASGGGPAEPGPGAPGPAVEFRGVPGFDTRDYPGDGVMARWREHSPYRWVGYYLPAPCYTGTSWVGRRATLERLDWGIAVLYVGEQDWQAMGTPPATTDSAAAADPRCTSGNLTADNGSAHARDALERTAGEGFPAGTTIFLDVERVNEVSPRLAEYVAAWARTVARDGRYPPGLYAHGRNAAALVEVAEAAAGRTVPLWVASSRGFDVTAAPAESGHPRAVIWQGAFDREERWGDVSLNIDVNVAARDGGIVGDR